MKNSTNNVSSVKTQKTARKSWLDRLLSRRWVSILVSLLMSVLLWVIVILQQPTQTYMITVPVSYDYNSPLYTAASLDIIDRNTLSVNVLIKGDSSVLSNVSAADIVVYPDYTDVSHSGTPGVYTLPLRARRSDNSLQKFEIDSVTPGNVEISFAQIGTQKYSVEIDASIDPAEGYYLGEKQASPTEVTLRGPVEELTRVKRVAARVESDEPRDRTMLDSAGLEFFDENGELVPPGSITVLEGDQVEVTIPILKIKEVPLRFEFSNVPAGYDPSVLRPSISPATIRIAGPDDLVDSIESINAGFINLTRIQLGNTETLRIPLADGLVNVDGILDATVSFNTRGYDVPHTITVSDIRVTNAPAGVSVKVITEMLQNVTLVGETEELAEISPADVIALVDASAQNITVRGSGQQQLSAQIIVTGTRTVFATGTYSVLCEITVE